MGKQAIVSFSTDQFDPEEEPTAPTREEGFEFPGEYMGTKSGRMHIMLQPELDQAFLDKRAEILITESYNKEFRGVYVGDDEDGNAVFDRINSVR